MLLIEFLKIKPVAKMHSPIVCSLSVSYLCRVCESFGSFRSALQINVAQPKPQDTKISKIGPLNLPRKGGFLTRKGLFLTRKVLLKDTPKLKVNP